MSDAPAPIEAAEAGVFTPDEVARLWQYQFGPWAGPFEHDSPLPQRMHPFTCGERGDHPVIAGDKGILVPTTRGWICPICDYTQNWAHGFMKGKRARASSPQTKGGGESDE